MQPIDVHWTPTVNMLEVRCECAHVFRTRLDRYVVRCCKCGKRDSIEHLRNELVRREHVNETKKTKA